MQKTISTKNAIVNPTLLYDPSEIRTGNMLPYRGNDIDFGDEVSLTKQAELPSTDINVIMKQYEKTGVIAHVNQYQGQYGDLGTAASYHDAMNEVLAAQTAFDSLPAAIRTRFGNDPGLFLDFVSNPANVPEMAQMGLVTLSKQDATPLEEAISKAPPKATKAKKPPSDDE